MKKFDMFFAVLQYSTGSVWQTDRQTELLHLWTNATSDKTRDNNIAIYGII